MRLNKSEENIWYLHEYYPIRYIEHIGISEKILDFKNGGRDAIRYFVSEVIEGVQVLFEDRKEDLSDMLICIMPSHIEGKYNEGLAFLADKVCSQFKMRSALYLIKRIKTLHREPQDENNNSIENMLDSLNTNHLIDIYEKSVLVIDDVTETGNTLKAAKELLIRGGAKEVTCITLGKTVYGTEREETVTEKAAQEESKPKASVLAGNEMDDTEIEYHEIDMSKEARCVANCVFETKGKCGISDVSGILSGKAEKGVLDTLGMRIRTSGILKDLDEIMIKCLILKMIQDGYLARNIKDGALAFGENIEKLKDPDTKVMVDVPDNELQTKSEKPMDFIEDTDDLTNAGQELLENLIRLRREIAREIAKPAFTVFSDKTLLQMCLLLPKNRQEMLRVSGVGEIKYERYGERFIAVILDYLKDHDKPVSYSNDLLYEVKRKEEKKQKKKRGEFFLTKERADLFEYADTLMLSEIRDRLSAIRDDSVARKATNRAILAFLHDNGYVSEEYIYGKWKKVIYDKGKALGIHFKSVRSGHGTEYEIILYPVTVQRMIVEHFTVSKEI